MKKLLLIFFSFSILTFINGQSIKEQVVSAGGGSFTNGLNSIDWTLGETIVGLYSKDNKLHNGFHEITITQLLSSLEDVTN